MFYRFLNGFIPLSGQHYFPPHFTPSGPPPPSWAEFRCPSCSFFSLISFSHFRVRFTPFFFPPGHLQITPTDILPLPLPPLQAFLLQSE